MQRDTEVSKGFIWLLLDFWELIGLNICISPGTETSTNLHQKLHYHVLGTNQSEDILCAEFPDEPKWMGGAEV